MLYLYAKYPNLTITITIITTIIIAISTGPSTIPTPKTDWYLSISALFPPSSAHSPQTH